LWKLVAGVEDHSGDRDRGLVERERFFHARCRRGRLFVWWQKPGSNAGRVGRVCTAVGDDWPTVVQASLDDVDLVATLRAVIGLPQIAGLGVNGQPDGTPNAKG